MATLNELDILAKDLNFQGKVKVSMAKAAIAILGEAIGSMSQAHTDKRQVFAHTILRYEGTMLPYSTAVASQVNTITPTDTQIDNAVTAIWDDLSGVKTSEM